MGAIEDYFDQERQRNRALKVAECDHFSQWHDVALLGPGKHGCTWDEHTARVSWCEHNLNEFWTLRIRNGQLTVFKFTSAHDAMMFKLVHGGSAPPQRKLP